MFNYILSSRFTRKRRTLREDGFTLIEIIVAMVIVGILAGISIPVLAAKRNNVSDNDLKMDFGSVLPWAGQKYYGNMSKPINLADLPKNIKLNETTSLKVYSSVEDGYCLTMWNTRNKTYNSPAKPMFADVNGTACSAFGFTGPQVQS